MSAKVTASRAAICVKRISIFVIVAGLFVLLWALPTDRAVGAFINWVEGLGFWAPVIFGFGYVVAAVLFVPGSALTLASGAVFGLFWGTVTVSIASTTAAGLSFLIARYLARDAVEKKAQHNKRFNAIDKAIGQRGWKIIALLRLSPAMPFSIGNYLFGLTAIPFWPYVTASWAAMLPGTFLYVYLGYIAQAAAGGGQTQRGAGQWALLIVGLLATVIVTVYVTQIARKAIKQQTDLDQEPKTMPQETDSQTPNTTNQCTGWPRDTVMTLVLALFVTMGAACAYLNRGALRGLFGPPTVTLAETYQDKPGGPRFDHSLFQRVVSTHVDADGWVDYARLKQNSDDLDRYIATLADAPFDKLGRDEKLTLLINAYNAFTLRLILDHYPIKSIKDIPSAKRWDAVRWRVGSYTWSLNQIEHEQVRPHFTEPRIHFALVCAAVGCPPLRNEAYASDRLDQQLEDQVRYAHSHDRWLRYSPDQPGTVSLTSLYNWYGSDFEQVAGSVIDFAARYSTQLRAELDAGRTPTVKWLDYDWSLNSKENKQ